MKKLMIAAAFASLFSAATIVSARDHPTTNVFSLGVGAS
jgi:hypothetical protein